MSRLLGYTSIVTGEKAKEDGMITCKQCGGKLIPSKSEPKFFIHESNEEAYECERAMFGSEADDEVFGSRDPGREDFHADG